MLEDLDKVDWGKFHHYYGHDAIGIPKRIRDLLSDDPKVWGNAEAVLFGEGQESGDMTDATGDILRFVIELLGNENTPKKASLLESIAAIAFNNITLDMPIPAAKSAIRAYDAVRDGMPILLQLLKNDNKQIRLEVARLLGNLTDVGEELIPELIEQYHSEKDVQTQAAIIESIGELASYCSLSNSYAGYIHFLRSLFESANLDTSLRLALSLALMNNLFIHKNLWKDESLKEQIKNVFKEAFFRGENDYFKRELVFQLSRLGDVELMALLDDPRLFVDDAHLVVRFLLHHVFMVTGGARSDFYLVYRLNANSITYAFSNIIVQRAYFRLNYPALFSVQSQVKVFLTDNQKDVLNKVLSCEPFWQIPTNLLSFFYGLPDSREELRKLIAES